MSIAVGHDLIEEELGGFLNVSIHSMVEVFCFLMVR